MIQELITSEDFPAEDRIILYSFGGIAYVT